MIHSNNINLLLLLLQNLMKQSL